MKKQSNGITIISLVITIIVLLILAGISIAEFTGSGLFAQTQRAKLEAKRSTITEWLDIKLIEEQTNNPLGTAEEIIEATRENVIQHQEELLEIGKEVEIEEIKDEENGEKTEVYFYVIVDEDVYKVALEGVKFIGKKGEFPPIIKITEVTNTTSTITVTVETQRNEGGKIEYWIKAEDEEEYIKKGETEGEEKSYKYEGLTQNKKYNIKVIAIAKNKKTAEATAEETTGGVPNLTPANITFTYNPEQGTWTNGGVTATASTTVTGYTLQTSKDGKTWTSTASQTFTANGTIYARLYDGTNYGGTASGNVTNIDTTKPVVTSATATTNSITIKATDEASGIIGYAVTTTNTAPTSFTSCTSTKSLSTTVSGKTQGTTYYVWVKDAAGNVSASKSTATGTVTDLTTANVTFTYNPAQGTWTNGSVTATASTTVTGYTLQTSKDGTTWTSTSSQTFTANGTIYARLYDGTNYGGTASGNVTNIDTTKPIVTSATATTNKITIKATDEASGIIGYAVTTTNTAPTSFTSCTSTKSLSTTVSGKTQGTTYYVWVKDAAGNVSASKSTATGTVTDLTTANVTFTYNPAQGTWTNGSVTATASTTVTGYTLQTSKDGKTWTSTASQTFTANGTIYARLYDGTNYGGTASGNITNIDTTKPVVTSATATTNTITIKATDEASGIIGYAVTTTNTAPTSFTSCTSTKSLSTTVSGKTQGTTYYVWVKDAAGNVSASKSTATGKVTDLTTSNTTFSYNPTGWTNGSVTATASTTVTGYTLQTSKDGKTWTSTASQTFTANGTIYARLYDGTNYGEAASANVTNIDKTAITISSFTGTASSTIATEATLSTTVNDADSGLSKIVWEWGTSTSYGSSATSPYTEMNGTTKGTTGSVTKNYSLTGLTAGTKYYAKITVYDVAGNAKTSTTTFTTGTAVAQVGSVIYTSIQNAVDAVSSSGTVTMVANTTEEARIPSGKTITLNLNSKTVTGKISNAGTVNISGGTITGSSNVFTNSGESVLTNVNITSNGVSIYNAGTCTLKSGNIVGTNGESWTVYNKATFNMEGGTIQLTGSGTGTAVINTEESEAKVNMSGGTIKSAIYGLVIGIGTAEVTGGTIQAEGIQPALLVRYYGSVTVKNTTIKNTGTGKAVINYLDYKNCIIRSRASNFGITGSIEGKVIATTNTGAGQSEETIKLFNVGTEYLLFPTWTNNNGQDDIKWYSAKTSNSTTSITIKKSNHNNETGYYTVHIYSSDDGATAKEKIFGENNLLTF